MQLAPIASLAPFTAAAPVAATPSTELPPRPGHGAGRMAPASPFAPASFEGAVDGVARLTAAPIVDFPGIVAGDMFDIVKGSKAGPIGVRGEAKVERLDPDHATFQVNAGRFGVNVDVLVDIVQVDAETVRITSTGKGIPNMSELGRIVEQRTNHAVFEQVSDPTKRTTISHDGNGGIVIDTVIPTFGDAHLVLERR